MMGVSARMMGVHRFNVLCAFRCYARCHITAGCAVLCSNPLVLLLRGNLRWLTATQELFVSRRYLVTGHSSLCLACSSSRSAALGA